MTETRRTRRLVRDGDPDRYDPVEEAAIVAAYRREFPDGDSSRPVLELEQELTKAGDPR